MVERRGKPPWLYIGGLIITYVDMSFLGYHLGPSLLSVQDALLEREGFSINSGHCQVYVRWTYHVGCRPLDCRKNGSLKAHMVLL